MTKPKQVRYIGSFLVILIPVLMMGILFYCYYYYSARSSIESDRLAAFQKSAYQMDYLFSYQEKISAYAGGQEGLLYITEKNGRIVPGNPGLIQAELSHLETMLPAPTQILLFFRGGTEFYTSTDLISVADFEKKYAGNTDFVMSGFFTKLNTLKAPFTYRLEPGENRTAGHTIAYIFPLPDLSSTPAFDLIFLMDEGAVQDILTNVMGEAPMNYYAFTSSYNLLIQNDAVLPEISLNDLFRLKGSNIISRRIQDRELVFMRSVSGDMSRIYLAAMDKEEFYRELYRKGFFLLALILLMTAGCLLLIVLIAWRRYQPLRRLVRNIVGSEVLPEGISEYTAIEEKHLSSIEENELMKTQLLQQDKIIISHFVLRLLTGKVQKKEDVSCYARISHLSLDGEYKAACRILFSSLASQQQFMDRFQEIQKGITLSEGSGFQFFAAELMEERGCGCIFCFNCRAERQEEVLRQTALAIRQRILSVLKEENQGLRIGVGRLYTRLHDLKHSYYEASTVLQFSRPVGEQDGALFYEDVLARTDSSTPALPDIEVSLLEKGILHGDQEVAFSAIEVICQRLSAAQTTFLVLRLMYNDVVKALFFLAEQLKFPLPQEEFQQLMRPSSLPEFREVATRITAALCRQSEERIRRRDSHQRDTIFEYIGSHYADPLLSLEVACEDLKLTRAKLNQILKEEIGTSFWQYISLLRFNEVKRQLAETDLPIQDIVRSVGYQDVSNFLRKFRETEGTTAKEYRAKTQG